VGDYKQTPRQAALAFEELKQMGWLTADSYISDDYRPGPGSERGAEVHWHKLLKEGHAAERILRAAEMYLQRCDDEVPSLAGFLSGMVHDCFDPDSDFYVPEHQNDDDEFHLDDHHHAQAMRA
jgi:hypothetical protein